MSASQTCYLDTGFILVLGYYLQDEPVRYQKVTTYLSELTSENIGPVVSTWGLIEAICRIWSENLKDKIEGNLTLKKLETEVSKSTRHHLDYLLRTLRAEKIKILPTKAKIGHLNIYKSIKTGFHGQITKQITQNGIKIRKPNYAGAPDLIHLQFASEFNCNIFATFDRGFENITEHKSIYSGKVKVIRH